MSSYLLFFCIYFDAWCTTCYPKQETLEVYTVIAYTRYLLCVLWCITCCWGNSAMFAAGGVRFRTAVVLLIQAVVVVDFVILIRGFSRGRGHWIWVFCCLFVVCINICSADYVKLPVLLYLPQCLVYHMLSKMRRSSGIYILYRVIGDVLVWSLLVVVYKIPYSSCMWTRQDVIGVFPSYYCLSGTTCVPAIVQHITTSLLLLST